MFNNDVISITSVRSKVWEVCRMQDVKDSFAKLHMEVISINNLQGDGSLNNLSRGLSCTVMYTLSY